MKLLFDPARTFQRSLDLHEEEPELWLIEGEKITIPSYMWSLCKSVYDNWAETSDGDNLSASTLQKLFDITSELAESAYRVLKRQEASNGLTLFDTHGLEPVSIAFLSNTSDRPHLALRAMSQFCLVNNIEGFFIKHHFDKALSISVLMLLNDVIYSQERFSKSEFIRDEIRDIEREIAATVLELETRKSRSETSKLNARNAAIARHKETYLLHQEALSYYELNRERLSCGSRAAAARELAKQVPLTTRALEKLLKNSGF